MDKVIKVVIVCLSVFRKTILNHEILCVTVCSLMAV